MSRAERRGNPPPSSRGAALVEAVVVLPVMIVLLAASVHVVALHARKQTALRQARQAAWTHALGGCPGPAASGGEVDEGHSTDWVGWSGEPLPPELVGHASQAGGDVVMGHVRSARAHGQAVVRAEPLLGLEEARLSSAMELPCNERPRSGSLPGALRFGWDAARCW